MQQYQVAELTNLLKNLVEHAFPGLIMVHGEVSSFSRASSGHMYFTLKDDTAKLKAAYFRQHLRRDSFIPKNGDKVSVIGELRVYEGDGTYQLIVRKVVYNAQGEFWQKFEETKAKLGALGLFNAESKRSVPLYPKRIALLTAASGAAVKDFIVTAHQGGHFFRIDIWPIPVQGKDATAPIVSALKRAGRRTDLYDVLVLSRGGGSLDDLAVFNEETVALALKESEVPTISAIGHEQDVSICDMVADLRVATPTAAAEKLTEGYKEAVVKNQRYHTRLLRLLRLRIENAALDIDRISARLHAAGAVSRLEKERMRLGAAGSFMQAALQRYLTDFRHRIERLESRLENNSPERKFNELNQRVSALNMSVIHALKSSLVYEERKLTAFQSRLQAAVPSELLQDAKAKLQRYETALISSVAKVLTSQQHRLEIVSQQLALNDPERPLSKGYALLVKDGNVITGIDDVSLDDELDIKMNGGQLSAFVTGKKRNSAG